MTIRVSRLSTWLAERATIIIVSAVVATAILAIPFLTMRPESSASQEPTGEVFAARDAIEDRFASSVFTTFLIIEDREGDLLRVEPLLGLLAAEDGLRASSDIGPSLFEYFDSTDEVRFVGMRTIADILDERLPDGLIGATDADVKEAAAGLIAERGLQMLGLSALTESVGGIPISPAILTSVLSDADVLGFADAGVRIGSDTEPEQYSRDVLATVRGDGQSYRAWGIAIDVNLTAAEQGEAAGPFIGFTILAVLIIVGLTFRSYWVLAVSGAALAALIIWLQGISNLVGLQDDLILSLIVPIAMISFGVDFAFHSVGRYRETRLGGLVPRPAFKVGFAAVAGALVLALASDTAAFLANTSAGIESIVQFGVGAAIALVAAFLLLGVVTPLAVMKIEERVGGPRTSRRGAAVAGAIGAGSLAMTSVLLSVFIFPAGGVVALGLYLAVAVYLPYRLAPTAAPAAGEPPPSGPGRAARIIGAAVAAVTRRRSVVLLAVAVLTIGAAVLALRVETDFDVKDFFAADSEFVVSLDKLDEHGGEAAGEPADVLIVADLTNPAIVLRVRKFADDFGSLDSTRFGRDDSGNIDIQTGVLAVLDDVWASPVAAGLVAQQTGVTLTDDNADGVPDTASQLAAVYEVTRRTGIPFDVVNLVQTPDDVRSVLAMDEQGTATRFAVGLPGSRSVENITAAREDLEPLLLRYGLAVVVPILIVVTWLYAFMFVAGFAINLVTATIGAVSIGIGIDFAIHFAVRYREELSRGGHRYEAVRAAGEGTGVTLAASAASSIVGFAILALAPMPLFASYGLLTAVMIAMALAASLLVLPALLTLITRDTEVVSTRGVERESIPT